MGEMGWTGSSDEGNNKCKWKLDRNGHAVKKGDCVGEFKMVLTKEDAGLRGGWDGIRIVSNTKLQ